MKEKIVQEYWLKKLSGELPRVSLPLITGEKQRKQRVPGTWDVKPAQHHLQEIPSTLATKLIKVAKNSDIALFILVLSGLNIVLGRYTGIDDPIVGTVPPSTKKNHHQIIFFRSQVSGNMTAKEIIFRTKQEVIKAINYSGYHPDDLVEMLKIKNNTDSIDIFNVAFLYEPFQKKNQYLDRFELLFILSAYNGRLHLQSKYPPVTGSQEIVKRFGQNLITALDRILDKPTREIFMLDILSPIEKDQLLYDFNRTETEYPKDKTIHRLFAEQVEKTPDHIALIGQIPNPKSQIPNPKHLEGTRGLAPLSVPVSVTYRQLHEKSHQLAYLLIEKGVRPDTIVGIMVERSLEMVVGIFAILKAGSAYLPIDPGYPPERINYILQDSQAHLLLTQKAVLKEINAAGIQEVIDLNNSALYGRDKRNLSKINEPGYLAYTIYTSGSTGRPKGILIEHASVVNLLAALFKQYPFSPKDTYLLKTPYVFDVSITELLGWFFGGGRLALLERGEEKNPGKILDTIEHCSITHINFVPSMFNAFLDILNPKNIHRLSSLKYIFLAGEALLPGLVKRFNQFKPGILLENIYGPTESTVYASSYSLPGWEEKDNPNIPIGKPLPNIRLYILDKYDHIQPTGVTGELCISGSGLARGYLNRPELTAEKFDHDLWDYQDDQDEYQKFLRGVQGGGFFKKSPPGRRRQKIYKTGDQARWLPDGNIEFLGRLDHQVKIRGFRIELGEIENQLLSHCEINTAVVITKEDENKNKYICTYIVSHQNIPIPELREYLSQKLPIYMLPAFFVKMDKIPLTHSGKVDRKALPDPWTIRDRDNEAVAPRNELEKKLVEIWGKVLGRDNIRINDHFFLVGGDSIKAIQIMSRMNKEGYQLELGDLFQSPVLSQLALKVKKLTRISDQSAVIGSIPLTPVQENFFTHFKKSPHHFNQAVMLYSKERFDEEAIKAVFKKLQEHHDALRMTYKLKKNREGEILQTNHGPDYPLSLQVYDSKGLESNITSLETKINRIQASIDLENGPLMKLGLFHLDDGDRLLIVIHHLVVDGVSWRILVEDINTLYQQYKKGEPMVLPLKTDSFKIWSEKLYQYANSTSFLKEKTYWAQLESLDLPPIPKDFAEEDNYLIDSDTLSFQLNEEETNHLLLKANEAFGTGINDILLTALALAMKETFGHNRSLIALEGHGREELFEDINISRTTGWFTTVYPILLQISPGGDLGSHIKEIKEISRKIPNHGIGHSILKYLTSEKNKEEIQFKLKPQMSFNYLGQFDADVQQTSFEMAKESTGNTQSIKEQREYVFDVLGIITNNQLKINLTFNKKQFRTETIAGLLNNFKCELNQIIAFCSTKESREFTPGDFTYKGLSIESVDRLSAKYSLEDIYTLTPMQEGMLFHALYDRSSSAYFEQISYRLQGNLDITIVEKSLKQLSKRHEILRTAFVHEGVDRPLQIVLKDREIDFYYEDIGDISGTEEKKVLISQFKEKDKQRCFDLSKDALMRVSILRTHKSEYEVIWSFHHIVMDGWCLGILNSEFQEIYTGYLENRPPQLPTIQPYRTYIQWLEKQDNQVSKNYWARYLDSYEEMAGIPGIKEFKSAEAGYKTEEVSLVLAGEKTNRLNKIAAMNHVTLNVLMQTVWGILLSKYNGKEDVVFGAVVSGRPFQLEGVESMIGLFINTIPIRIRPRGEIKFNELLAKVQEEAIASEPHHYCPLAEIQSESELRQDLIDHIFVFENFSVADQIEGYANKSNNASKLMLSNVDVFEQTNYPFNVIASFRHQISMKFKYNGNIFAGDFVERIANHYFQLLYQVMDNQKLDIKELILLSSEEKNQILYDFNDTKAEYPKEKTIHELFEEQVESTPGRIALKGTGGLAPLYMSYRELQQESNQLAHLLKEKGVQPEAIVGLMTEPSVEMIIGILGILKAGSAYLPLDPEYPEERIDFMLKDSNTMILLKKSEIRIPKSETNPNDPNANDQNKRAEVPVLDFEHLNFEFVSNFEFRASNLNPSNLSYIIYTSGSTGKPKGVIVQHQSLVNLCYWHNTHFSITTSDRAAKLAGFGFDASVWEIFPYLIAGASLYLVPIEIRSDILRLNMYLEKHNITVAFLPTQLCEQFITLKNQSLRLLLTGGDKLKKFAQTPYPLVNNYGPTENTVVTTSFPVTADSRNIPIGSPINNTRVYILDNHHHLQPIGIPGELCIGGDSLVRGYLNNPELTFERFINYKLQITNYKQISNYKLQITNSHAPMHPCIHESPHSLYSPIYRTGDLAKWLSDGNIEFLGRTDQQVKIRGFRVELEEIERLLLEHHAVEEAVVIDREHLIGDRSLCAYIVPTKLFAPTLNIMELREYLLQALPDFMIPAYFVIIAKIPLTLNGKVDRKALPAPEIKTGENHAPPRDKIEEKLAEMWSSLLEIKKETISIDDNFFHLGGHSLKASILVSRIHKKLDVEVSLAQVFKKSTIRQLAVYIKGNVQHQYAPISPTEQKEYYPLSSAQKRLFILNEIGNVQTVYNLPNVWIMEGPLDKQRFEDTFVQQLKRHEVLRTSFTLMKGKPVQIIHEQVNFQIQSLKLDARTWDQQTDDRITNAAAQFTKPFDLSKAPLLRVALMKLAEEKHLIIFDMHHIITDGISMGIFIKDFTAIYRNAELPPLKIQYKDFSRWQTGDENRAIQEKQETYWLDRFKDGVPILNLPTDYPRPAVQSFAGSSLSFKLGKGLKGKIKQLNQETETTLNMVLLAVYTILLSIYSGQKDVVVGLGIAGRTHPDVENMMGFFVNTIAIRNQPEENQSFEQFLNQVKQNTLQGYENQGYPFEELVNKLGISNNISRNPLFDVAFVVQNMDFGKIELEKLKGNPYRFETNVSRFDLQLAAWEVEDTIALELEYSSALFKRTTAQKFTERFAHILNQVLDNRNIKLADITILHDLVIAKSNVLQADTADFGF